MCECVGGVGGDAVRLHVCVCVGGGGWVGGW